MSTNNLNIVIRPVRPEDAEDLQYNCFSANFLDEVKTDIEERIKAFEKGQLVHLVAEVEGVVIGTGILTKNYHPYKTHRGKVGSLVVHPDYQRKGIARSIIDAMHCYAESMGLRYLDVGCRGGTPAENVYPRLGFFECSRIPEVLVEPWGENLVFDEVSFYMPVVCKRNE